MIRSSTLSHLMTGVVLATVDGALVVVKRIGFRGPGVDGVGCTVGPGKTLGEGIPGVTMVG